MNASGVAQSLHLLIGARQPVFIWGPPGIGNSDVVRQVAGEKDVPLREPARIARG
jgi:MoxR-like ATPase